ncbi:hypothetical protein NMG60_11025620 [Bertholletia excelsa]
MGTLLGHIVPGLALVILGLWHTINTISAYHLRDSKNFVSRFWHPLNSPFSKLKHLELLLILSFSIFSIFVQVMDYPSFHFAFKLNNYEHVAMFLHLAIFAGFALCAELTHSSEILSGVSGVLATSVFGQELFLLHYHSTDHIGLEGHYHWLLQLIVFASLMASLFTTTTPSSFPSSLVLAVSVMFQGFWFINMGFMLWFPQFVPRGCIPAVAKMPSDSMHGAVICQTHKADMRARAVANMQFSWILAGIMIFTACVCLRFARSLRPRGQSTEYEQLQSKVSDVSVAIAGFKQTSS